MGTHKPMKGPMEEIFELEEEAVEHLPFSRTKKEKILMLLDLVVNIVVIVALVVVVRRFLISPFQVFGPSMCNSLNYIRNTCYRGFGEYLIVNKAVYQNFFGVQFDTPDRGDIIIFRPPKNHEDFYIKRVIGLPGEKVLIRDGKVSVQLKDSSSRITLNESYLNSGMETYSFKDEFVVPEGHYFTLGDNRRESTDSRTCFGGGQFACKDPGDHFLPEKNIQGKAWLVLWPFSKIRAIKDPSYAELQ